MNRSAPQYGTDTPSYVPRASVGRRARGGLVASEGGRFSAGSAFLALIRAMVGAVLAVAAVLVGPGLFLDTPQPAPRVSDAIVVISGDEQMARFSEGINLYERGMGRYLVFSGAAVDNGTSNADVMRAPALRRGVPSSAPPEEPLAADAAA